MLFGALDSNIFMLFSGPSRELYEQVILAIYEECFGADLLFPTQSELVGLVYDLLARRPDLWHEEGSLITLDEVAASGRRLKPRRNVKADREATSDALSRARHIYARLIQTGWLEESRYGLRVTVDMPAGAMRLAEFLASLKQGSTEQLGGLVIEVKNALEAVRSSASQNALGLHKAARDAVGFGRYLRSVLSALRDVDRRVLASENLNERLQRYFEDFVERVLLRDYAAIATTAHPYRFRYAIFEAVQALEDSPVDIDSLTAAYSDAHLASDLQGARDLVFDDLDKIRRVFQRIDEAFQRIQQHRMQLEVRLRNTVRYAGRRADSFLLRSREAIARLDRYIEHAPKTGAPLTLSGALEPVTGPIARSLLARPRGERPPLEITDLALSTIDPIHILRRRLESQYLARITVRPQQVIALLERALYAVERREAAELPISDLDDFLAFEALRRTVRDIARGQPEGDIGRALAMRYSFQLLDGTRVDNPWVDCENFLIARLDDDSSRAGGGPDAR